MNKTLWIIGGGVEAVPTIRRARAMGLTVVVADGNPQAPGFALADIARVVSTYDIAAMLAAAQALGRPIDGVLAASADVPRTVAALAAELGLPGISRQTAELAADKLAMKRHFRAHGVPVPDFWPVETEADIRRCLDSAGGTVVIKPVDSRGARGVLRLTGDSDLAWALRHARAPSPTGRVMCEAFIAGPQFSTESILLGDAARTPAIIDRNYARLEQFAPYMIEDGGTQPSAAPPEHRAAIARLAERAARVMGITRGTAKGDLVVGPDGPMVIEMAARLSGGWMATDQIPLHSGVDFVGLAIRLALGDAIDITEAEARPGPATVIRYVFPPPGRVVSLSLPAHDAPWVHRFLLDLAPGEVIPPVTDHTRRVGLVLVSGADRAEAVARAEALVAGIRIEILAADSHAEALDG